MILLPPKYRLVVVLRYWYDMSYEEIAQTTKLSEAAVKTRLHRAREMLSERVEGDGGLLITHEIAADSLDSNPDATHNYSRHGLVAHS